MRKMLPGIREDLQAYIQQEVFPTYDRFYSHGMMHIDRVIENCLMLAETYNLNPDICYAMAAYHDAGLKVNRAEHERESGKIVAADKNLLKFFGADEVKTIKEAVEDHRGSRKTRPRSIYGEVLSDSDRDFDIEVLAQRQIVTSIKNYPEIHDFDGHFDRCHEYISRRINDTGHFNLWTNHPVLVERRAKFEKDFLDREYAKKIYRKAYDLICSDEMMTKIRDFYEDF